MKEEAANNLPVEGIVRAKLCEGFALRLPDNASCFVPIKHLLGYTDEERFERYDSIGIDDAMTVLIVGESRRPTATEIGAIESRAESNLQPGTEVEFFAVAASEHGVAVRIIYPSYVAGLSAYIYRNNLSQDQYDLLQRDIAHSTDERVGRLGRVKNFARNQKQRLCIKLVMQSR